MIDGKCYLPLPLEDTANPDAATLEQLCQQKLKNKKNPMSSFGSSVAAVDTRIVLPMLAEQVLDRERTYFTKNDTELTFFNWYESQNSKFGVICEYGRRPDFDWRHEVFCSSGHMIGSKCYLVLEYGPLEGTVMDNRAYGFEKHCLAHLEKFYNPLLVELGMDEPVTEYVGHALATVNDRIKKELIDFEVLEQLLKAYIYPNVKPFHRAWGAKHLYRVNSKSFPLGYKYEGIEGQVLPYAYYSANKSTLNRICPKLRVMNEVVDRGNQYFSTTKGDPIMVVSLDEGYCGANKTMYYIHANTRHIEDSFYTTNEKEYNQVWYTNTWYKGEPYGKAFYVW
ncbi:hypothetical protein QR680_016127 [Steinernema hermaphroditum]|uniref:Uncharacterized protein n=1 Tax=Steinernema hermaphroditum TaxID=289476 RepID=A0AA39HCB2_9BILA|nr:hypothetical protein QR680_016127 [Steinernema hermaphroditum]